MPIKIFLDTSDTNEIKSLIDKVDGITTNPSLMKKAGIKDYEKFCKEVLEIVKDKPVSFEVFADDFDEMERQARIISSWGENVYVKIPIMNTKGESSETLLHKLLNDKIKINLTAITNKFYFDTETTTSLILSIFAGRIADTGLDPSSYFHRLAISTKNKTKLLWASCREVLNIYQAEQAGADIITVTPELFRKYEAMKGKDLNELSLDTVKQFYNDAKESGFKI